MKRLSLKKLNKKDTADGVIMAIKNMDFSEYNEETISFSAVFKGKEKHTRSRKKADCTRVKLQSYSGCEGAENALFIAVSVDSAGKKSERRHISCTVFVSYNFQR